MTESGFVLPGRADAAIARRRAGKISDGGGTASRRLVVVSNRVTPSAGAKPDSGGLAVAIRAALQQSGGIWFGWSGEVRDEATSEPAVIDEGPITFATVDLTQKDFDQYYIGYANRALWPLFHFRSSLVQFSRHNLVGYLRVNRMFARSLAPMLSPDDLVWVHDYHLIPLGEELRKLDQSSRSAFSCIRRSPPPSCFASCPTIKSWSGRYAPMIWSASKPSRISTVFVITYCAGPAERNSGMGFCALSAASSAPRCFRSASMSPRSPPRPPRPTAPVRCAACTTAWGTGRF